MTNDIAQIISDECAKVGITVNIRQTDFQKMVEMLTATYDWQTIIIGLGSNLFPSQGSNVWQKETFIYGIQIRKHRQLTGKKELTFFTTKEATPTTRTKQKKYGTNIRPSFLSNAL